MFDSLKKSLGSFLLAKSQRVSIPTQTPSPSNVKGYEISRNAAFYWQQFLRDTPIAFIDVVQRCRYYALNSSYLQMLLPIKASVYNFKLRLTPCDESSIEKKKQLEDWLDSEAAPQVKEVYDQATNEVIAIESHCTNRELIHKFIDDLWDEFLLLDNAIAFWLTDRNQATLLPTERCLYSDVLGLETLKYQHGLAYAQILQLPEDQHERFRNNPAIFINPNHGEHYKVLKRSPVGDGLKVPSIISIMTLLGEIQSKEFGFHQMGWLMRKVTRHHKLGHEIKSGPHAGKSWHFWSEKKSTQVKAAWHEVTGIDDYTSGFDHDVSFPWPEMEFFDEKCWKGSDFRIMRWAGPIGQILSAKAINPTVMNLLRAQVLKDRSRMEMFLTPIISKAFQCPVPCRPTWSDAIFLEDRLRSEFIKFGALQGQISPQTYLEEAGQDPEREAARKLEAVNDPDVKKKFMPIFDPAHCASPALDGANPPKDPNAKAKGMNAGSTNGRPAGGENAT